MKRVLSSLCKELSHSALPSLAYSSTKYLQFAPITSGQCDPGLLTESSGSRVIPTCYTPPALSHPGRPTLGPARPCQKSRDMSDREISTD